VSKIQSSEALLKGAMAKVGSSAEAVEKELRGEREVKNSAIRDAGSTTAQ
jgi:hypothetical protein